MLQNFQALKQDSIFVTSEVETSFLKMIQNEATDSSTLNLATFSQPKGLTIRVKRKVKPGRFPTHVSKGSASKLYKEHLHISTKINT